MCVKCTAVAYAQGGPQLNTDRMSQRAERCSRPRCRSDGVEVPYMTHQERCQWGLGYREPSPGWRKNVAILREMAGPKPWQSVQAVFPGSQEVISIGLSKTWGVAHRGSQTRVDLGLCRKPVLYSLMVLPKPVAQTLTLPENHCVLMPVTWEVWQAQLVFTSK